jgi:hypothetical protein
VRFVNKVGKKKRRIGAKDKKEEEGYIPTCRAYFAWVVATVSVCHL